MPTGERRKPALGTYGQITINQMRKLAKDDPIRKAAETVASRRRKVEGAALETGVDHRERPSTDPATAEAAVAPSGVKTIVDDRSASFGLGDYRPGRNRKGENRAAPPKSAHRIFQLEDAELV